MSEPSLPPMAPKDPPGVPAAQPFGGTPYPSQSYPSQSYPSQSYPSQSYPAQIYPAQLYPTHETYPIQGAYPALEPPRPKRRRRALISLALVATVLLCAGGGVVAYLLVQDAQPRGEAAPSGAIEGFLTAVFTDHSAPGAAGYVCPDARDEAQLDRLVSQVKTFADRFDTPRTTWKYSQVRPDGSRADATVTLTLRTANEQVATKRIRLSLVDDRGWWVCDAQNVD